MITPQTDECRSKITQIHIPESSVDKSENKNEENKQKENSTRQNAHHMDQLIASKSFPNLLFGSKLCFNFPILQKHPSSISGSIWFQYLMLQYS